MCLASNHHFLLIQLLLPKMLAAEAKGGKPRIVLVNSALAYERRSFDFSQAIHVGESERNRFLNQSGYAVFSAYGQAKIGSMLCLNELSRRLTEYGSQIPVNAMHPGEIDTDIVSTLLWDT